MKSIYGQHFLDLLFDIIDDTNKLSQFLNIDFPMGLFPHLVSQEIYVKVHLIADMIILINIVNQCLEYLENEFYLF